MDGERWNQVMDLFDKAIMLPEDERAAFAMANCGGDREIEDELLGMLRSYKPDMSTPGRGQADIAFGSLNGAPIPDDYFPPYRKVTHVASGGFGMVFSAEREDGNKVAIKTLAPGFLLSVGTGFFAREVRIQGKLNHPNIAHLYHAGQLKDGTPYLVMEWVEGRHLDDYCRETEPPLSERLNLFRQMCAAMAYAQRLAVLHRDLKPSNVMVTGDREVKLLDFGIARELSSASGKELPTVAVFTPSYAAPEQIESKPLGTFTDVYSLGAILFELLTRQPLSRFRSPSKENAEPPKPSEIARSQEYYREATPTQWVDLDRLCRKALRKEVDGIDCRYDSAAALLRDVDNYLKSKPLEAGPASFRYVAGKWVRRNRFTVAWAAAVMALVAIFLTIYVASRHRAQVAQQIEAARTERVSQFLTGLFQGDIDAGPAKDLRVVALLDRGVRDAQALSKDPAIQAQLFDTLGTAFWHMGDYTKSGQLLNEAITDWHRAMGAGDPHVARVMGTLALLRLDQGMQAEAESIAAQALEVDRKGLPKNDPALGLAETIYGHIIDERGRHKDALPVLQEAVRVLSLPNAPQVDLLNALNYLSNNDFYRLDYVAAEAVNQSLLAVEKDLRGPRHPDIANDLINLGNIAVNTDRFTVAEKYDRDAWSIMEGWYGPTNPQTLDTITYVSQVLLYQRRYQEASDLMTKVIAGMEKLYPNGSEAFAIALNQRGGVEGKMGAWDAAEADFKRAIAMLSRDNPNHDILATFTGNLGDVYFQKKLYGLAERTEREAIDRFERAGIGNHVNAISVHAKLGRTLAREGRYTDAERELLNAVAMFGKMERPDTHTLSVTHQELAGVYEALGNSEKSAQERKLVTE